MNVYYNENNTFCVEWLKKLMSKDLIPKGDVDDRSIVDVKPSDLEKYDQCHFFSGIGGWAYALQLARWPEDQPVWTGSCPCQPFSSTGKQEKFKDARHLWPSWFSLIKECRPNIIFGEQVAGKGGLEWLDVVFTDFELAEYTVGAANICAEAFGLFHLRQRLYFVADTESVRLERGRRTDIQGGSGRGFEGQRELERGSGNSGIKRDIAWVGCRDGKTRPLESGIIPVVDGISERVGRLSGYGNAICPAVAKAFIESYLEVKGE